MEGMGGLDGMTGLIPLVIVGGVVMKITDTMLGPKSQAAQSQKRVQKKAPKRSGKMKINKTSIAKAAGKQHAQLMKAAQPVKMTKGNSDPSSSSIFKTVRKSMKGKKLSYN